MGTFLVAFMRMEKKVTNMRIEVNSPRRYGYWIGSLTLCKTFFVLIFVLFFHQGCERIVDMKQLTEIPGRVTTAPFQRVTPYTRLCLGLTGSGNPSIIR